MSIPTATSASKSTGKTGDIAPPGEYAAPDFDVPTIHVSTEAEYSPAMDDIVKRIRALP